MRDERRLPLLCLIALPLLFAGLCHRGFTDNEGMYAEIGREMLHSGNWLTPHINGGVYLNKPPLLFWLTAALLRFTGINELPRLISGLAVLATMLLVYDLGRRLWPRHPASGAWAAAVFLSSALTPIEARILRPDALLACFICLSLWGVVRVSEEEKEGKTDRRGATAIWGGIGLGVMTKGLLGVLLPALILVPALLLGRARNWRRYCPWWGLLLAAALILPWHVAAGVANPGFWWDYLVNQHLLYFFDRKYPRDSVPQPLWFAWAAFAGRLSPWMLWLPAALAMQLRLARRQPTVHAWLPLTWLGMIWLFFSLSKGRLEHYFLPAVPAAALLVGRLCDEWAAAAWAPAHRRRVLPFVLICLTAIGGELAAPALLRASGVLETVPDLQPIAQMAFATAALGALAAAGLALARRYALGLGALAATFLLFGAIASRGMDAVAPLVSPRQLVASIDPVLLTESSVAYEAGTEYQLCGGLNFYLRRRLLLLEPPGFIPPTYLRGSVGTVFIEPERFWREWRKNPRRILLFSDPDRPHQGPGEFPQPCYELARGGGRLLLTNRPPPPKLARAGPTGLPREKAPR